MEPGSSNPYTAPQALPDPPDPLPDSGYESPLPPYTPVRLLLAFALICVGWLTAWALCSEMIKATYLIPVIPMIFRGYEKVTNPNQQRRDANFKWYHMVLSVGGFVAFLLFIWSDEKLPLELREQLMHPATLALGWLITCGRLLNDWKKRRNNPPYQPKPHAELPTESPWKPLPRR